MLERPTACSASRQVLRWQRLPSKSRPPHALAVSGTESARSRRQHTPERWSAHSRS